MKRLYLFTLLQIFLCGNLFAQNYHKEIMQEFIRENVVQEANQKNFIGLGESIDREDWVRFREMTKILEKRNFSYNEQVLFDGFMMLYKYLMIDYYDAFQYVKKYLKKKSFWNMPNKDLRSFYLAVSQYVSNSDTLKISYLTIEDKQYYDLGNIAAKFFPGYISLGSKGTAEYLYPGKDPYSKFSHLITIFQFDKEPTKSLKLEDKYLEFAREYPKFPLIYERLASYSGVLAANIVAYSDTTVYSDKVTLYSTKAADLAPNTPFYMRLKLGAGSKEDELTIDNKMLQINPDSLLIISYKIFHLLDLDDIDEANRLADKAIGLINTHANTYDIVGTYQAKVNVLMRKKKYSEAKKYLDKMVEAAPDYPETYRVRAKILYKFPETEEITLGLQSLLKLFKLAKEAGDNTALNQVEAKPQSKILIAEDWHYFALYLTRSESYKYALFSEYKALRLLTSEDQRRRIAGQTWYILDKLGWTIDDVTDDEMRAFLMLYTKEKINYYESIKSIN